MQIATENQKLSNTVKWVVDNSTNFTNEVAIARETANKTYKIGDVVGAPVSGKVKLAVETASDGSKVFYGVVLEDKVVAANTDVKVLVAVRGPMAVNKSGVYLDSTYDNDTKKNVVYAAMEAAGIQLLDA
jgi:hypothetical protein